MALAIAIVALVIAVAAFVKAWAAASAVNAMIHEMTEGQPVEQSDPYRTLS